MARLSHVSADELGAAGIGAWELSGRNVLLLLFQLLSAVEELGDKPAYAPLRVLQARSISRVSSHEGKTVVITGATSGIGEVAALTPTFRRKIGGFMNFDQRRDTR
jgi:hypothetical protein